MVLWLLVKKLSTIVISVNMKSRDMYGYNEYLKEE